jgi:hypothetical protein
MQAFDLQSPPHTHKANLPAMAKPTHGWQTQGTHALSYPQQIEQSNRTQNNPKLTQTIQAMNQPTPWLLNLFSKHCSTQSIQPSIPELPSHIQSVIIQELLHSTLNPNTHEGGTLVAEEVEKRIRNVRGVDELEDEAASAT